MGREILKTKIFEKKLPKTSDIKILKNIQFLLETMQ